MVIVGAFEAFDLFFVLAILFPVSATLRSLVKRGNKCWDEKKKHSNIHNVDLAISQESFDSCSGLRLVVRRSLA